MPLPSPAATARPDHVLVCTDGSPDMVAAAQGGAMIARRVGAALHLVHVHTDDGEQSRRAAEAVEAQAAELGGTADILGLDAGGGNDVAGALARHIDSLPDALACLSTHGRGAIGQSVFGSVTADLVRARPRPFLVFGPRAAVPQQFSRVVVCTDGSDLSEAILPSAAGLARDLGLPAWVVEVLEPPRTPVPSADLTETSTVQRVAGTLRDAAGDAPLSVSWEVLHGGRASDALADYADGEEGTITALATHGRGGLAGKLIGSVAQEVTRRATGPVLLLRPEQAGSA